MAVYLNPSPASGFLANLFGQGAKLNKRGAFKMTEKGSFGYAPALFTAQGGQNISDFLNLTGSNAFTSALGNIGRTGDFNLLPEEIRNPYFQATGALDQLIGSATPVVQALIETGMPVDIGSLVTAAQSRYRNQILPQLSEQYNPAEGTAFQNIAAREGQLLADELGQLDYAAQEAARARQLQGVTVGAPTLGALATTRLGLPSAVLGDLTGLSESSDPGGRLLSALLAMLGQTQQPAELLRTGKSARGMGGSESSGTGDLLGSLGSILGIVGSVASLAGACWVAEELWGVWDEKTWLARIWCIAHQEHPFVQRYLREGQRWAANLREHPELKPAVEPSWLWMAEQGARMLAIAA